MSEPRKVPLIVTEPSAFGEIPAFDPNKPAGLETDGTYVPGFSEQRVAFDTAVGRFKKGEIGRSEIPTLDVNLRWARSQNKAGNPDSTKPFKHSRNGYRYVTREDVGKPWFKEEPGGCIWAADGTLRNGDTVLMVAPKEAAARNEANRRRETESRSAAVQNTFTNRLAEAGVRDTRGTDPSINKMAKDEKLFQKGK